LEGIGVDSHASDPGDAQSAWADLDGDRVVDTQFVDVDGDGFADCQKAFHAYNYAVTPPVTDSPATIAEPLGDAEDACDHL
jgi:hypothetical protein